MTMPTQRWKWAGARLLLILVVFVLGGVANAESLRGVDLASPAFSGNIVPGVYGQDFIYPNDGEVTYFTERGMNVFRLSVLWERIQPVLNGHLDTAEMARLTDFIADAEAHGASVLIDIHNYGYYYGTPIGQNGVSSAAFANLWMQIAQRFGRDHGVLFGLMNEPKQSNSKEWQQIVQQAITAIRATGAQNYILVSGLNWDSALGFAAVSGPTLSELNDSQSRIIFEVHEYFDPNASGTSDRCVDQNEAIARLAPFTHWLRSNGARGFLGEFGVSRTSQCLAVLDSVVSYLEANSDVWLGWTYWAAGPMWGDYMFTLEPENGSERPQMQVLDTHLKKSAVKTQ